MQEMLFTLANSLAALIAYMAADSLFGGRESWRKAVAAVGGFCLVASFSLLATGTIARLSSGMVVALLVFVAFAAVWLRRLASDPSEGRDVAGPAVPARNESFKVLTGSTVLAGLLGVYLMQACVLETRFKEDDLSYHAPAAAEWLIEQSFTLAPAGNYTAHYPLGGELFSLWFMLPLGADGYASLAGAYWALLTVMAIVGASLAIQPAFSAATFAAALVLASPLTLRAAGWFSAVDLAGPALMLSAFAMSAPAKPHCGRNRFAADAVYAGLFAGLAVGCKVTFAPPAAILLVWFLFRNAREARWGSRIGFAGLYFVCAAIAGGFWYVRNFVLTGNPIFPAALGPFAGPMDAQTQQATKLVHWLAKSLDEPALLAAIAKELINWPVGLFLLSVLGYASTAVLLLKRPSDQLASFRWVLLASGLAMVVLMPFTPFSGGANSPTSPLLVASRLLIFSFCVGMVLYSQLLSREGAHEGYLVGVTLIAILSGGQFYGLTAASAFGASLCYVAGRFALERIPVRCHAAALSAVLLLGMVGLTLYFPIKQWRTDLWIQQKSEPGKPVGRAWARLEQLPPGSRVACFGTWQTYPLFGRRLQLTPVAVKGDGRIRPPLYQTWQPGDSWWSDPRPLNIRPKQFLDNLVASDVGYVFVTKWNSPSGWPAQYAMLQEAGRATPLYDDGFSAIWKIE